MKKKIIQDFQSKQTKRNRFSFTMILFVYEILNMIINNSH